MAYNAETQPIEIDPTEIFTPEELARFAEEERRAELGAFIDEVAELEKEGAA